MNAIAFLLKNNYKFKSKLISLFEYENETNNTGYYKRYKKYIILDKKGKNIIDIIYEPYGPVQSKIESLFQSHHKNAL